MVKGFQGFPKEMFTFLEQLTNNNNREWFNANKARYKSEVVAPVMEFIDAIRANRKPSVSEIDIFRVMDVCFAVWEASQTGRETDVSYLI